MAKKSYKIVAHTSYKERSSSYVVKGGLTKREANKYLKEKCYTTASRTFTIEDE